MKLSVRLTLRQLAYFESVARLLHFGQAAEECAVSQPALSVQVQELEKNLGVALIERKGPAFRLTREGEEVAERARRILREVSDLAEIALPRGLSGPLRLGVIPTVAPYLLPPLLAQLALSHPDLTLQVRETTTARLTAELLGGALDVLLLALPVEHEDLESMPLFEDVFLLAAPAGWTSKGEVDLSAIDTSQLLLLEEGHCLRDQALAVCTLAKARGYFGLGATSLATLIELVAAGQGLTLMPQMCERALQNDPRLALRPLCAPQPARTIGLTWRRNAPRRQALMELGAVLRGLEQQQAMRDRNG